MGFRVAGVEAKANQVASTIVLMSYNGGQLRADIVVQGRSGEMGAGGRINGWVVDMEHNL